jgi:hypothetical protein
MILRIGKELRQFRYARFVWCVAFSPDGTKVLICSEGARLLDLATGAKLDGLEDYNPTALGSQSFRQMDHPANCRLSLSETSSGWRLTENRAMLSCDERSFQAHWLDGCRSISAAGRARGGDLDIAPANKCFAADCS